MQETPIRFWSQLQKGAEERYSLVEKQLEAVYAALLACESITGPHQVTVQMTYPGGKLAPVLGHKAVNHVAQMPKLTK